MTAWALLPALFCLLLLPSCKKTAAAVLLDADGAPLAEISDTLELYDASFSAYAKYAAAEAAEILARIEDCDADDALKLLQTRGYRVHTAAVPAQILAAEKTGGTLPEGIPFALAATDDSARLTAIYSTDGAVAPTYAGSAIKPLSVYAPGIESGLMNWSSLQPDSPVKTLSAAEGGGSWPVNGSGVYSNKNVTAAYALAKSLNTVAVRWLTAYGPENAMDFLENGFGMDLSRERSIAALTSADEVLGNLALGYLQEGVTVCEMAGYYRIFNDGGCYTPAYTVEKIEDAAGRTLYTAAPEKKRVVSEETAYIVNRMLKDVVEKGTGTAAKIDGLDLVGKTGTSDNYGDNWFVGVTPTDTVAVWHGAAQTNSAAALTAAFLPAAGLTTDAVFAPCPGVEKKIFCPESGLLVSADCPGIEMGYYKSTDVPDVCGIHGE